jgi:hypothetical protein
MHCCQNLSMVSQFSTWTVHLSSNQSNCRAKTGAFPHTRARDGSTHLAIADGVAEAVRAAGAGPRKGLLTDVEVEVGHYAGAVLRKPVALGGAPRRRRLGGGEGVVNGDDGGRDEAGLHVPREPHLRVPAGVGPDQHHAPAHRSREWRGEESVPGPVVNDDGWAGRRVHGAVRAVDVVSRDRSRRPSSLILVAGRNGGGKR